MKKQNKRKRRAHYAGGRGTDYIRVPARRTGWDQSLRICNDRRMLWSAGNQNCRRRQGRSVRVNLTILGMRKGENEYTYPQYERVQAEELLECLRKIAPCIIIDCSSYIANDILSAVSLMEADSVLRLTGCDLKSVSYFSSQLPLLKESKWDADKQYKAASNVRPNEASAHMEQVLGNTVFQIPYSREVEEQVLQGNLFKELGLKESRGFRRAIEAVTGEVFGC